MISSLMLERPGRWRPVGLSLLLLVAALPALPLLSRLLLSMSSVAAVATGPFVRSLQNSFLLAFAVAAISLFVGLPLGVLVALFRFPARLMLLSVSSLLLLVPSFLWCIGWSSLAARLGPTATSMLSGFSGCVFVHSISAIPLTLFVAYAACTALSPSQLDATRLAGSETSVLKYAARNAMVPTMLAATLGGILTFSDVGPGQILGLQTAASEVLTTFSALYDFTLAAKQCCVIMLLVLAFAAPVAYVAAPRIAHSMLARQLAAPRRLRNPKAAVLTMGLLSLFILVGILLPFVGLTLPLANGIDVRRAVSELIRTGENTLLYAAGAGVTATSIGLLLAFFVGRSARLRAACLGISLTLFSLPSMFSAIGIVQFAADAPAWADIVLRSRITVCLALGFRFFPIATVLALRAWGSTSASWSLAAGLHGVSLQTYVRRVALPLMLPAAGIATLLVALLATADIGTVLLLHPPGQPSFPLALFTVMANAPESFVASLCLVYILAAAGLLAVTWMLVGGRR